MTTQRPVDRLLGCIAFALALSAYVATTATPVSAVFICEEMNNCATPENNDHCEVDGIIGITCTMTCSGGDDDGEKIVCDFATL